MIRHKQYTYRAYIVCKLFMDHKYTRKFDNPTQTTNKSDYSLPIRRNLKAAEHLYITAMSKQ